MTAKRKSSASTWVDKDDAPEITDDWIADADLMRGDAVVRRGRPPGKGKTPTTVRLDDEILAKFKASGPRWQTRLNAALADWLKTHSPEELPG
jgi:uncharacterized protein (DUF4415 family)